MTEMYRVMNMKNWDKFFYTRPNNSCLKREKIKDYNLLNRLNVSLSVKQTYNYHLIHLIPVLT